LTALFAEQLGRLPHGLHSSPLTATLSRPPQDPDARSALLHFHRGQQQQQEVAERNDLPTRCHEAAIAAAAAAVPRVVVGLADDLPDAGDGATGLQTRLRRKLTVQLDHLPIVGLDFAVSWRSHTEVGRPNYSAAVQ
jgi:hypothetical protein